MNGKPSGDRGGAGDADPRAPKPGAGGPARRRRLGPVVDALPEHLQPGPWWVVSTSLAGLVLAIAVVGFVSLTFNHTVSETTQGALRYDVALQDDADDLRVAILDVRHYHRDLVFYGPSELTLSAFDGARDELLEEINEIEKMGTLDPSVPQPEALRLLTDQYFAEFRPALDQRTTDPAAFEASSAEGLVRLKELERLARDIDLFAEEQADLALARIEQASSNARLFLLIVIGGLVVVGGGLVYAANRVIKEVRRLYEAEQAASKGLSEALQAKSDFVADASHELRTPLTVLRGNAEAGLAIDPNCAHREILEEIVQESAWMTRLVEDLLFLARSDASAPPLKVNPVAVARLLQAVADRAEILARQWDAVLETTLLAEGTLVADAARIEQAILALIDNAAKFSPPGGAVRLSSMAWQGELIVEVADDGPGIGEADLTQVFERFYRTDKARNRQRGGAGLGLSIARTIIEAHGGRITAHSRLSAGTRMRIHLPLAIPAVVQAATAPPELVTGVS